MGSGLPLLERLERDVVLGAEGYLFELERRGYLQSGPFVPEVVLDYPDAVRELHREFSGSGDVVREMYREQVRWAVEAGADFIVAETNDYLGEALIGVEVIREHGLPAVVTFASTSETTMDGYELDEACKRVENAGADVVGLNCSRGPATMFPILERVRAAVSCPVAAQPVPYRTTPEEPTFVSLHGEDGSRAFPVAHDPFLLTRFEMADFAGGDRDLGVSFIGICCGGAPHHVRSMAEALGRTVPASRYSPAMELHPVLGENVKERDRRYTGWQD